MLSPEFPILLNFDISYEICGVSLLRQFASTRERIWPLPGAVQSAAKRLQLRTEEATMVDETKLNAFLG